MYIVDNGWVVELGLESRLEWGWVWVESDSCDVGPGRLVESAGVWGCFGCMDMCVCMRVPVHAYVSGWMYGSVRV